MLLPLEIAEEGWASHYEFMDGWHSNPHTVGLLSHLDANPYDQESNRTAFDNGRALMTTRAGQQYRRYIETCRRKAMATAPGIRVP
jgi:hypothetical protein